MNKTLFKLVPALRQANCFHWLTIMLIIPAFFVTGCSDDAASGLRRLTYPLSH